MDPHSTPEPLSLSDRSAISPGYTGQDDPAFLLDEGLSHLSPLCESESQYPSILHLVPGVSNDQLQLCDTSLSLPLEGLPLTRDQVTDPPILAYLNDAQAVPLQAAAEMENRDPLTPGVPMLPALLESSSTMFSGFCSSPESYTQSILQDDYADVTSFPRGHLICELVEVPESEENPRLLH